MRLPALSYANVMSTVAVFVALGGSSYAAVKLGRGQVKGVNLASDSVSSAKVKNGSLLAKDFKAGQLPAGAIGPQGPKGEPGAAGAKGADGAALLRMTHRVEDATVQTPQVVATIGGQSNYSGAYSGPLHIPQFDSTKTYVGVLVTAAARFTAINGTHCKIQVSENGGLSFTTYGSFQVLSTGAGSAAGSGSAAIPAFTPGATWHFQLLCQSDGGPASLDEASIGVTAAPVSG